MSENSTSGIISSRGNADSSEYATPPSFWRPLSAAVDGFDLDPASGAESTPIADARYTKADNGLQQDWFGDVFLNPPWGDSQGGGGGVSKEKWLKKAKSEAAKERVRTVTVLITCDPTTDWFQRHVIDAPVICFLSSRIQFVGENSDLPIPLCVAVYGQPTEDLVNVLEGKGSVFLGRKYHSQTKQEKLVEWVNQSSK